MQKNNRNELCISKLVYNIHTKQFRNIKDQINMRNNYLSVGIIAKELP